MEQKRHYGLMGPLLLVAVGVILLLNNLGMASISLWDAILRLWPILIVGLGLDILIGRRSLVGSIIVALLVIAMFVGGIWLMNNPSSQALPSQTFSQVLSQTTEADMSVDFPVGKMTLAAGAQPKNLVEGSATLPGSEAITTDTFIDDTHATVKIRRSGNVQVVTTGNINNRTLDIKINPNIPTALKVESGVGETIIDLTGTKITKLNVNAAIGSLKVTLPAQGQVEIALDNAIGDLVVYVPQGAAVQIEADDRLGGTQVNVDLNRQGNTYTSSNYNTSSNRIHVTLSGGIGTVRILPVP